MANYEEHYGVVVFLDALGIKGIWKHKKPKDILANWESLVSKSKKFLEESEKLAGNYTLYAFSDTIIIVAKDDDIEILLLEMGKIIKAIIIVGIVYDFYFRGCMSIGEFFESKENIIIGPAVDEASQFYETTNWIGVHTTSSASSILQRLEEKGGSELDRYFINYNIPTKKGTEKGWAVKLHHDFKFNSIGDIPEKLKDMSFKDFVHYQLEHPTDPIGGQKWKNTLDFITYIKSEA